MKVELWAEIRRLRAVAAESISEIARRLRVDRKTVRAALRKNLPEQAASDVPRRPSKLDAYKTYITDRVKEYPRIPATALYEEIRAKGYTGKMRIVWEYVAHIRAKRKEAFLRIETEPGECAQVDWANCGSVSIGGVWRKLSCFVMVLSYSRMMYLEFTLSQCLEDFLRCHINAFRFFGGLPRKILYDNLKTVVLARMGKDIALNPRFLAFAGTFLFEPVCCNPARGNEKGKVESGIKYIRSSFLSRHEPLWPDINAQAITWRDETANKRLHSTTRARPIDLFALEQPQLLMLPAKDYDASIIRAVSSSSQALVHFDGNRYSVPYTRASTLLTLKAAAHEVRIFHKTHCVAHHVRSFERGKVIEDPKHFEGLLAEKKKAFASKVKEQFLALGPVMNTYYDGLRARELNLPHHITGIMDCVRLYGKIETLQALDHAISHNAYGAAYVKNIIIQQRAARGLKEPLPIKIAAKPAWTALAVEEQNLSLYDDLSADTPQHTTDTAGTHNKGAI